MNGFEQRQSLVRAFVNTRVEWVVWVAIVRGKSILEDELINSNTSRIKRPDVEEIDLVRRCRVEAFKPERTFRPKYFEAMVDRDATRSCNDKKL
jgi:hypothetical protein